MVFRMFVAFLIFDPNGPFGTVYSLCKMADFQNSLISRIFGISSSLFLHKTTLMFLQNGFSHVYDIFNFSPNLTILQRLQALHRLQPLRGDQFLKLSHFWSIWCFFERFFAHNNCNVLVEWFFAWGWCSQTDHFAWVQPLQDGRLLKLSHFWNIWCFFRAVFCKEQLECSC